MSNLEVIAQMRVRPGEMEGFKRQAAEMVRLTRELDTGTLRYDWYVDEDAMACEVHELYADESGMVEHNQHIVEAREQLFREYASDHRMSVYGPISQHLADLFAQHAGGVAAFSFLQGLDVPAVASR